MMSAGFDTPIGESPYRCGTDQHLHALRVADAKARSVGIGVVELGQVAGQVFLGDVVVVASRDRLSWEK